MDPILLQKQLRENNTDLQDYYKDIQSWGEEMKRKEASTHSSEVPDVPLLRNKISKTESKSKKAEVTQNTESSKTPKDFSYWEKFDAEAECDKIDKSKTDDDSDLTDEYDESAIEMAQEEKEKGNKFVKAQRWKDALKCYTQAIALNNYDSTFYANRALCHLKLEQFKNAEADCTIAIQLDDNYVKAIHRRAVAREALKQYKEAKEDLERVLVVDPENKESQKLMDKIEKMLKPAAAKIQSKLEPDLQRPVSKFTASRQNKPVASTSAVEEDIGPALRELVVERKRPESTKLVTENPPQQLMPIQTSAPSTCNDVMWPFGNDVEVVKSFIKSPKERSRVPLKRVDVNESSLKISVKP